MREGRQRGAERAGLPVLVGCDAMERRVLRSDGLLAADCPRDAR